MERATRSIVVSVPLGYYARNLLRAGVLEELLGHDDVRMCILTPGGGTSSLAAELTDHRRISLDDLPVYPTQLRMWQRALYKGCLTMRRSRRLLPWAMAVNERVHYAFEPRTFGELFRRCRPDLVVTASPGFHSNRDLPLVRQANCAGIRTLCVVFSWDNLATHLLMPTRPHHLAVWNEMMRDEAIRLHHYHPDRVTVVGPTHFDLYQRQDIYLSREAFCRQMGLDPSKRIVLVAAMNNHVLDSTFLLDVLVQAMRSGAFPEPIQVLYRPHPLDPTEVPAQVAARHDSALVCVDRRDRVSPVLRWDPTWEDMVHLANVLKHSDVVLSFISTIAIEAALLDRPVINLEFSTSQPAQYAKKMVAHAHPKHYRYLLERNGMKRARTPQELLEAICSYLRDPSQEQAGRRRIAEDLCYRADGRASRRLASLMMTLARP